MREISWRPQSFWKVISKNRAETTSLEIVWICHGFSGILPKVNHAKHDWDANSVTSGTERLAVSLTRSQRKVVHLEECYTIWLRIPGCGADEIQSVFTEGPKNPWDRSAACDSQMVHYATEKIGKERVHPKVYFSILILTSVVPMLQHLKTDLRKKP